MSGHEPQDKLCDRISLFVEREMPGIEQMKLCLWKVAPERLGTRRDE